MSYPSPPWVIRSGNYASGVVAGAFAFLNNYGYAASSVSFRQVLTIE